MPHSRHAKDWDDKVVERLCHFLMSHPAYVQRFTVNHHYSDRDYYFTGQAMSTPAGTTTIDINIRVPTNLFQQSQNTEPPRQMLGNPMLPASDSDDGVIDGELV